MNASFLTWAPYHGGLNNTRMEFETVAALAHMTGRVLAIPEASYRGANDDERAQAFRPLHPWAYFEPFHTLDAATVGFNGANKYLNDLWRDRTHGDTEVAVVVPAKRIT